MDISKLRPRSHDESSRWHPDGIRLKELLNQQRRIYKRLATVLYGIIKDLHVGLTYNERDLQRKISAEALYHDSPRHDIYIVPDSGSYNIKDSTSFRRYSYSPQQLGGNVRLNGVASSQSVSVSIEYLDEARPTPFLEFDDLQSGLSNAQIHHTDSQRLRVMLEGDSPGEFYSPAELILECRERHKQVINAIAELMYKTIRSHVSGIRLSIADIETGLIECSDEPFSKSQGFYIGKYSQENQNDPIMVTDELVSGIAIEPFTLSSKGGLRTICQDGEYKLRLELSYKGRNPKTPVRIKKPNLNESF